MIMSQGVITLARQQAAGYRGKHGMTWKGGFKYKKFRFFTLRQAQG